MTSNKLRYARTRPVRDRFAWGWSRSEPGGQPLSANPLFFTLLYGVCPLYDGFLPVSYSGPAGLYALARLAPPYWQGVKALLAINVTP